MCGSSAGSSCTSPSLKAAAPASAEQQEIAIVKQLVAKGWKPTAAGAALLAGHGLPAAQLRTADGTETGIAILATNSSTARTTQAVKRITGQASYFFYCGLGQRANLNFTTGNGQSFVDFYEENFQTNGTRTISTTPGLGRTFDIYGANAADTSYLLEKLGCA